MIHHPRLLGCVLLFLLVATMPAHVQQDGSGWTPDLALKTKRVGSVTPSPDGRKVAFIVGTAALDGEQSEWVSQIHVANADGAGAFQLTHGEKSSTSPRWSPDGSSIGFISARGGKANVYRIRVDGGEAEQLTDEKGGVTQFEWAPDGASLAFVMTDVKSEAEEKADKEKRDARVVDENYKYARVHVAPVEKSAEGKRPSRLLTKPDMHVFELTWSPDGKAIAVGHQRTPKVFDQTDVSLLDVASGALKPIASTPAHENDAKFSHDGKWLALVISDNPPTWASTARVHLVAASGGAPKPLANTFDEQPDIVGWSADDKRLIVAETRGTAGRLSALPIDGGAPVDLGAAELAVQAPVFNAASTMIGFVSATPERAPEAFVAPIDRFMAAPEGGRHQGMAAPDGGRSQGVHPSVVQVSRVQEMPSAEKAPLGRTEVISWKAPDGLSIEGLLTYPAGYRKGTRVPLLVMIHGGPTGVFTRSTFIGTPSPYPVAAFASRGYAVLRCNVRGSSGYGRTFRYANHQDWGGGDYRDIMAGVDHVIKQGVADPERLGVMGWSYGGYMTSWIITQTKRFKAASVGAGVTNLMSFTGTADIPGFIPDYFGGEFWDVFDRWRAHSAMFNIKGVSTPTLIQHGEKDERVPISQGYELYNALVRQKVPAKMVVYPRQPHGIQEPKLLKDAMERNLEWFDRWIMKKEPGKPTL